jgi:hypothetical protein
MSTSSANGIVLTIATAADCVRCGSTSGVTRDEAD